MLDQKRPLRRECMAVSFLLAECSKLRQRHILLFRQLLQIFDFPEYGPMSAVIVRIFPRGLRAVSHPIRMCAHFTIYVTDVPCVPRDFELTVPTTMRRINVHVYWHSFAQGVEFSK